MPFLHVEMISGFEQMHCIQHCTQCLPLQSWLLHRQEPTVLTFYSLSFLFNSFNSRSTSLLCILGGVWTIIYVLIHVSVWETVKGKCLNGHLLYFAYLFMSNRRLVDLLFKAMVYLRYSCFVSVEMVITVFNFSAQKGLIGPSGMPGPAGPKGERVSIYYVYFLLLFLHKYRFKWEMLHSDCLVSEEWKRRCWITRTNWTSRHPCKSFKMNNHQNGVRFLFGVFNTARHEKWEMFFN